VAAVRHRRAGQLGLGLRPDREPQAGPSGDLGRLDQDRAPLLFIGGEKDHIMPPSVNKSNARHYENSPALTEYVEFEGRDHWTCGEPGWEAVADYALEWAAKHARTTTST
jgi:pimeloyl-ACP methyl ester carboxylesterase